jgi:hypothetical protein
MSGDVFKVEDFDTPYQLLGLFRDAAGFTYNVKPFEKILSVKVDGTDVTMLSEVYIIRERARGLSVTGHGKRLVTYRHGRKIGEFEMLDEDFQPFEVAYFGTHRSIKDYIDQVWWERDCYRPGTGAFPQDNYYRQQEGYHPTERVKMDRRAVEFA